VYLIDEKQQAKHKKLASLAIDLSDFV
jgi:hypothetical protein